MLPPWKGSAALPPEDAQDGSKVSWERFSRQWGLPTLPSLPSPQHVKDRESPAFLPQLIHLSPTPCQNVFTHVVTRRSFVGFFLWRWGVSPEEVWSVMIYLKTGMWLWDKMWHTGKGHMVAFPRVS